MTENERRLHRSAELAKLMIDRSLAAYIDGDSKLAADFAADVDHHLDRAAKVASDIRKERAQKPESD
jgi:phosphate uptake regulator